jgi:hypothetical protein
MTGRPSAEPMSEPVRHAARGLGSVSCSRSRTPKLLDSHHQRVGVKHVRSRNAMKSFGKPSVQIGLSGVRFGT